MGTAPIVVAAELAELGRLMPRDFFLSDLSVRGSLGEIELGVRARSSLEARPKTPDSSGSHQVAKRQAQADLPSDLVRGG